MAPCFSACFAVHRWRCWQLELHRAAQECHALCPFRRRGASSRRSFSSSPTSRSLPSSCSPADTVPWACSSASSMKWGKGNFLVRTRDKFAAHNLMVAVDRCAVGPAERHEWHFSHERRSWRRHRRSRGLSEEAGCRSRLGGGNQHGDIFGGGGRDRRQERRRPRADVDDHARQAAVEHRPEPSSRRSEHAAAEGHDARAHRLPHQGRLRHHAGCRRAEAAQAVWQTPSLWMSSC